MPPSSSLPKTFIAKKKRILEQLSIPEEDYDDLSPKGSVDEGIRDLIDEINDLEGFVTTSSCGGRISVFLEGKKSVDGSDDPEENVDERIDVKSAGVGGKGGGGRWLYVSHDPIPPLEGKDAYTQRLGLSTHTGHIERSELRDVIDHNSRFVHFKFEPMILHVLTASLQQANTLLSAALQAGFRESGALNLIASSNQEATPMVAIRSMGLAMESIVGVMQDSGVVAMVPDSQLRTFVEISNQRFIENTKRIERFRVLLKELCLGEGQRPDVRRKGQEGDAWEDADARRERKKLEGLKRAEEVKKMKQESGVLETEEPGDSERLNN